jgi:hypothetical protein
MSESYEPFLPCKFSSSGAVDGEEGGVAASRPSCNIMFVAIMDGIKKKDEESTWRCDAARSI